MLLQRKLVTDVTQKQCEHVAIDMLFYSTFVMEMSLCSHNFINFFVNN